MYHNIMLLFFFLSLFTFLADIGPKEMQLISSRPLYTTISKLELFLVSLQQQSQIKNIFKHIFPLKTKIIVNFKFTLEKDKYELLIRKHMVYVKIPLLKEPNIKNQYLTEAPVHNGIKFVLHIICQIDFLKYKHKI